MPLTSQIKELGVILQKLIKFMNLEIIPVEKLRQMRWIGVVGDADELLDEVVGSVQQRKRILCSLKNLKMRKRKKAV